MAENVAFLGEPFLCDECRYDLRATSPDGFCPECGLKISASREGVRVSGRQLVIRYGAVLPQRCIKTNVPIEGDPIAQTLPSFHPVWGLLLSLAFIWPSILLLIVMVFFLCRNPCRISYYASPGVKLKIGLLSAGAILVILAGAWVYADATLAPYGSVRISWGLLAVLLGVVALMIARSPIWCIKHRKGEFWIGGCGKEFLESVRRETHQPGRS